MIKTNVFALMFQITNKVTIFCNYRYLHLPDSLVTSGESESEGKVWMQRIVDATFTEGKNGDPISHWSPDPVFDITSLRHKIRIPTSSPVICAAMDAIPGQQSKNPSPGPAAGIY